MALVSFPNSCVSFPFNVEFLLLLSSERRNKNTLYPFPRQQWPTRLVPRHTKTKKHLPHESLMHHLPRLTYLPPSQDPSTPENPIHHPLPYRPLSHPSTNLRYQNSTAREPNYGKDLYSRVSSNGHTRVQCAAWARAYSTEGVGGGGDGEFECLQCTRRGALRD
jgi:hypothetical protein